MQRLVLISSDYCCAVLYIFAFLFFSLHNASAEAEPALKAKELYKCYCTPCHGLKGNGDGFNAKNLDPRPAKHADPNFMTRRTDQELFDAISVGGKGIGKSTLMPPWGNTFDKGQIESLVQYLRKLCRCQGE